MGTRNKGKQSEFSRVLGYLGRSRGLDVDLVFPDQLGLSDHPVETGGTFEENSAIKARQYHAMTGLPTLSDDGGLEIFILGGEPGVRSRRWLGHEASDEELIGYCLERLEPYPRLEDRSAALRTCITYYDGESLLQECEQVEGIIAHTPATKWTRGYPYRALFKIASLAKYYDELTPEEHLAVNHRAEALTRLFDRILREVPRPAG